MEMNFLLRVGVEKQTMELPELYIHQNWYTIWTCLSVTVYIAIFLRITVSRASIVPRPLPPPVFDRLQYVLWSGTAPPGVCHLSAWYLPALPPPYLPFWVDPFLVLWTRNGTWTHSGLQPSDRHHMKVYCLSSWRQSPHESLLSVLLTSITTCDQISWAFSTDYAWNA